MSRLQSVRSVVEAEREAKKIIADAQNKAQELKRELERKVTEGTKDILADANRRAEALIEEARSQALREADALLKESSTKLQTGMENAKRRKSKALQILLGTLVPKEI